MIERRTGEREIRPPTYSNPGIQWIDRYKINQFTLLNTGKFSLNTTYPPFCIFGLNLVFPIFRTWFAFNNDLLVILFYKIILSHMT